MGDCVDKLRNNSNKPQNNEEEPLVDDAALKSKGWYHGAINYEEARDFSALESIQFFALKTSPNPGPRLILLYCTFSYSPSPA